MKIYRSFTDFGVILNHGEFSQFDEQDEDVFIFLLLIFIRVQLVEKKGDGCNSRIKQIDLN